AWADPSVQPGEERDCGQACHYRKGNENLSLTAYYEILKTQALDDETDPARIRDALEGFCLSGESASDCLDRYRRVQGVQLIKVQSAMLQNNGMIHDLASRNPNPNVPAYVVIQDESQQKKRPIRPDFPSYREIQRQVNRELISLREQANEKAQDD